jgi:putative FmdB family regulatory protein
MVRGSRWLMPRYDFLCQSCKRFFSKTLTLFDYEQNEITCPNCGSDDVEQGRWVAFHPPLSKKSA